MGHPLAFATLSRLFLGQHADSDEQAFRAERAVRMANQPGLVALSLKVDGSLLVRKFDDRAHAAAHRIGVCEGAHPLSLIHEHPAFRVAAQAVFRIRRKASGPGFIILWIRIGVLLIHRNGLRSFVCRRTFADDCGIVRFLPGSSRRPIPHDLCTFLLVKLQHAIRQPRLLNDDGLHADDERLSIGLIGSLSARERVHLAVHGDAGRLRQRRCTKQAHQHQSKQRHTKHFFHRTTSFFPFIWDAPSIPLRFGVGLYGV